MSAQTETTKRWLKEELFPRLAQHYGVHIENESPFWKGYNDIKHNLPQEHTAYEYWLCFYIQGNSDLKCVGFTRRQLNDAASFQNRLEPSKLEQRLRQKFESLV